MFAVRIVTWNEFCFVERRAGRAYFHSDENRYLCPIVNVAVERQKKTLSFIYVSLFNRPQSL